MKKKKTALRHENALRMLSSITLLLSTIIPAIFFSEGWGGGGEVEGGGGGVQVICFQFQGLSVIPKK